MDFVAKPRPGDGTALNHAWACGTDTAYSQALVAVVALSKRLLNSRFLTFSESKCCLSDEWRTESVVKASSWVTCWLNIAIAACRWVNWVMGGKVPKRDC